MTFCSAHLRRVVLAAVVLVAAVASRAKAQSSSTILLEVDVTNRNSVLFTSTGAASLATYARLGSSIRLENALLAPGANYSAFLSGPLTSAASGGEYRYSGDLTVTRSLFLSMGSDTQAFVAGQPAFAGSATANLWFVNFSPVGTIGNITVRDGFGGNPNVLVGQYLLVPSPGSAAVMIFVGSVALRRKRLA